MIVLSGYEMPLVFRGSLDEAKSKEALEDVKKLISGSKGEVGEIEEWGKKALQFEIAKETSAYYFLMNFEADQKTIPALGNKLKMQDSLLRFLIIKKVALKKLKEKKPARKAPLSEAETKAQVAAKEAQIIGR